MHRDLITRTKMFSAAILTVRCSKLMLACLRWTGRLFHSFAPAAAKHLSP